MEGSITDVNGIAVGHAGDAAALTGCTVVLVPEGATVGVDVRGSAPGTRETDLCRPGTLVEKANAVLLTGGSAFGLESAGGVMRYLRERSAGFPVGSLRIPIVPAAVIFDLAIGEAIWPDADMAYRACMAASTKPPAEGCVGAGLGATVGKVLGPDRAMKSGVGTASTQVGPLSVGALVVVNAFGHVLSPSTGRRIAGARHRETGEIVDTVEALIQREDSTNPAPGASTTIGVVATDAELDSASVNRLARVAHDGLARTISPVHSLVDGDTLFGLATGDAGEAGQAAILALEAAAVLSVQMAVVCAVTAATAMGGLPAAEPL